MDLYSLAAIAVECDMSNEDYKRVKDERGGKSLISKHLATKGKCKRLAELTSLMILDHKNFDEPSHPNIIEIIKEIKF